MIRRAELRDAEAIFEILKNCDDAWSMHVIEEELSCESSKVYVYDEDAVLGFVDLKLLYDEADLMHIAVREDARGRGIGRQLLEKAIDAAGEMPIALEVREGNTRAISLYESHGFKKESIRKNYYHGEDAVIMWRRK